MEKLTKEQIREAVVYASVSMYTDDEEMMELEKCQYFDELEDARQINLVVKALCQLYDEYVK